MSVDLPKGIYVTTFILYTTCSAILTCADVPGLDLLPSHGLLLHQPEASGNFSLLPG